MVAYYYIVAVVAVVVLIGVLARSMGSSGSSGRKVREHAVPAPSGTCGLHSGSCGAVDPVNDPAYNIKEVIKNTLLIEQHLAEKKKYCKPCLIKHFLLSIGLLEEAIWMAGESVGKYNGLEDSLVLYTRVFDTWRTAMNDDAVRLDVLGELRGWRQKMIEQYYFDSDAGPVKSV